MLLAATERDAVEPLPEELVEASGCVGDFVHLAQLRRDQQASRR